MSESMIREWLIHGYPGIDNDTLWSIITDDLPVLLPNLQDLWDKQHDVERVPPVDP